MLEKSNKFLTSCILGTVALLIGLIMIVLPGCSSQTASSESSSQASGGTEISDITVSAVKVVKDPVNKNNDALTLYETSDGAVVYDLDLDKKSLKEGQAAAYEDDADGGLLYILRNGYPYKSFVNNDEYDGYITQMAIWWYMSENQVSADFREATGEDDELGLVQITRDLVEKAKAVNDKATSNDGEHVARIFANEDSDCARVVGLFPLEG